jgi:cysteine synthase A
MTNTLKATVLVKLECMNPLGSIKDRIGVAMITDAEEKGLISPDKTTIIEPTSGNTGISLAFVSAAKGYRLILTMPDSVSTERRKLLAALGAKVILTAGEEGMAGCIAKASGLAATIDNSFIPQQFSNPANPAAHRRTTGPELWEDSNGKLDIFVSAVGTGGTITGVAQYLKARQPQVQIVAVEPQDSAVITQKMRGESLKPGTHKIQGIGTGFIPEVLDLSLIDQVITVSNDDAFTTGRRLALEEGVFAGISTGANVFAALELACRPENEGKTIMTLACSTGERYLSTSFYDAFVHPQK